MEMTISKQTKPWNVRVKSGAKCLALTTLCEHPGRRTGLTTYFHGLVRASLKLYPDIHWVIFAGKNADWPVIDDRVRVVHRFPANDRLFQRIWADHMRVPAVAKEMGADALLTVGFVPMRKLLPTVMGVFSLQHVDPTNKIGSARQVYRRFMTRSGIKRADFVITNSESAVSQIKSAFPQFSGRMLMSYDGLDPNQFQPEKASGESSELKREFKIEPGYFLWVSNFYPYKQAELLLESYSRLEAGLRAAHPLVMVGGGWNGDSSAMARARALGIESNVRFLGWIDDRWLAPLYRNAVAFCLASREETFGRIVTEAMACGTPCILNDIPIMHEVSAEKAVIVDFQNTPKAAAALERIVLDQNLHARLRVDGLNRAADFSFEKMTRERIDAILEFLRESKA
jgi:glycosyltransferase involved in cell wall biosynthesis